MLGTLPNPHVAMLFRSACSDGECSRWSGLLELLWQRQHFPTVLCFHQRIEDVPQVSEQQGDPCSQPAGWEQPCSCSSFEDICFRAPIVSAGLLVGAV